MPALIRSGFIRFNEKPFSERGTRISRTKRAQRFKDQSSCPLLTYEDANEESPINIASRWETIDSQESEEPDYPVKLNPNPSFWPPFTSDALSPNVDSKGLHKQAIGLPQQDFFPMEQATTGLPQPEVESWAKFPTSTEIHVQARKKESDIANQFPEASWSQFGVSRRRSHETGSQQNIANEVREQEIDPRSTTQDDVENGWFPSTSRFASETQIKEFASQSSNWGETPLTERKQPVWRDRLLERRKTTEYKGAYLVTDGSPDKLSSMPEDNIYVKPLKYVDIEASTNPEASDLEAQTLSAIPTSSSEFENQVEVYKSPSAKKFREWIKPLKRYESENNTPSTASPRHNENWPIFPILSKQRRYHIIGVPINTSDTLKGEILRTVSEEPGVNDVNIHHRNFKFVDEDSNLNLNASKTETRTLDTIQTSSSEIISGLAVSQSSSHDTSMDFIEPQKQDGWEDKAPTTDFKSQHEPTQNWPGFPDPSKNGHHNIDRMINNDTPGFFFSEASDPMLSFGPEVKRRSQFTELENSLSIHNGESSAAAKDNYSSHGETSSRPVNNDKEFSRKSPKPTRTSLDATRKPQETAPVVHAESNMIEVEAISLNPAKNDKGLLSAAITKPPRAPIKNQGGFAKKKRTQKSIESSIEDESDKVEVIAVLPKADVQVDNDRDLAQNETEPLLAMTKTSYDENDKLEPFAVSKRQAKTGKKVSPVLADAVSSAHSEGSNRDISMRKDPPRGIRQEPAGEMGTTILSAPTDRIKLVAARNIEPPVTRKKGTSSSRKVELKLDIEHNTPTVSISKEREIPPLGSSVEEIDLLNKFLKIAGPNFDGDLLSSAEQLRMHNEALRDGISESFLNKILDRNAGILMWEDTEAYDEYTNTHITRTSRHRRQRRTQSYSPGASTQTGRSIRTKSTLSSSMSYATERSRNTGVSSMSVTSQSSILRSPISEIEYGCMDNCTREFWSYSAKETTLQRTNTVGALSTDSYSVSSDIGIWEKILHK